MQSIKAAAEELAHMGKPMDNEDIIAQVLDGLDFATYRPVIEVVRARDTLITFEALHEKLLQRDLLNPSTTPASVNLPTTALTASHKQYSRPYTKPNNSAGILPLPSSQPSATNNSSNQAPFKGKCQWCHQPGHYLELCADFKKQFPHITPPPRPAYKPKTTYTPQVNTATTSTTPAPRPWILNSGATHHISQDLDTLALHAPYDGTGDLIIGDGSSLPIHNIGSFSIPSSTSSIKFTNVLHVPTISRNIISISQLCLDNSAIAIFSHGSFCLKDCTTGKILLHGQNKSGLYEWLPTSSPTVCLGAASSSFTWQHRLGYPSSSRRYPNLYLPKQTL
ncbi:hypothetical protein RND81_05G000700 [Saponaria officinalis]|uniref:Retrovirus-related Pol polyprotein from transposon TNT 1-94-like beta-barrel domain-containing protein n=1 Tax=Saponaria officinalis TaxID=3572 RepID=A0AAW1KVW8_SAPOF